MATAAAAETQLISGIPLKLASLGLALATFLIVLDYSIANVSIPYISGDLSVSTDQGTYVITAFAAGSAIILPMTGWLSNKIGPIRLLVLSLVIFTLLSMVCGAAFTFPMLILSRFLQGIAAGPLAPLAQSILIAINPKEKKERAIALFSCVLLTGPVAGPLLGGWLTYDYSWPWIFYINLPIGILAVLLIWLPLRKRKEVKKASPFDWVGFILLAIGVSCLQIVLDKGEQWDWWGSPLIKIYGTTAFLCFTFLIAWELLHPTPLLELRLFKIYSFFLSIILILVMYSLYFGSVVLIPLWLQTNMGYTSTWAGLAVTSIGFAPILISPFMGGVTKKYGPLPLLALCVMFFSLSCFVTAFFDTDVDFWYVSFSRFILGIGLALLAAPLIVLNTLDLPIASLPSGAGIFHFIRAMFGGVGTSIFTTMWIRRTIYHHFTLGESVTPFSANAEYLANSVAQYHLEGKSQLAMVNQVVDNQAAMLALNDCFWVMAWVFLALIPFIILGKFIKPKQKPAAPAAAVEMSMH